MSDISQTQPKCLTVLLQSHTLENGVPSESQLLYFMLIVDINSPPLKYNRTKTVENRCFLLLCLQERYGQTWPHVLRNKLLWRNELYPKSSLKSQRLKQKVTNPQTQQRSFSLFVLFALLVWAWFTRFPLHTLRFLPFLSTSLCWVQPVWRQNVFPCSDGHLQHPTTATTASSTGFPSLSCSSNLHLIYLYPKPIKDGGKTPSDLNGSYPVCVCILVPKFWEQYAYRWFLHSCNSTAELASLVRKHVTQRTYMYN